MAKWPLDPNKIWGAFKEIAAATAQDAGIVLAGDPSLTAKAQEALSPDGWHARLWQGAAEGLAGLALGPGDVLLVLVQPNEEDVWAAAVRAAALPLGAVVVVDDGPAATQRTTWYDKHRARVSFSPTPEGWTAVWTAVVEVGGDHVVALGRRFPILRGWASRKVIKRTARQNGLVGAAFIVPGTDMPIMTLNQIKMVLSIAAIHGEEITTERAIELVGVVGSGFGMRAVARQALDLVPGPGWLFKGAVGYTGTRALGEAALRYFDLGAPATPGRLSSLARRIKR
ncbi:MAG TPA: hypothetical protein VFD74_07880 [Thermoleophilia bacterium]|nr:hypothetical protein [Thermoleophilia bacterium]